MKNENMSLTIKILKKLAPKIGAKLVVEPEWKHSAQIIYKNGKVKSFHNFSLDLNRAGSSNIAKDKSFSKYFLEKEGFPVAQGDTVLSDEWAKAMKSKKTFPYAKTRAKELGYPVIVKPNTKSQGVGVSLVYNNEDLKNALQEVFYYDKVAILEKYLPGRDYRILVLDDEVVFSLERTALSVIGDGKSSIAALFKKIENEQTKVGRKLFIDIKDNRIIRKLKQEGYTPKSILGENIKVNLLPGANLSTGGEFFDVSEDTHPLFKKMAISITKKMGLRICGVDIMITNGDITMNPKDCKYYIIEINSAPGFDHYAASSLKNLKTIENMYLSIIKKLEIS